MADFITTPTHNFERTPVVTEGPYQYDPEDGGFTAQNGAVNA